MLEAASSSEGDLHVPLAEAVRCDENEDGEQIDFDEDAYWRFSTDGDDIDDNKTDGVSFSHSSFEGPSILSVLRYLSAECLYRCVIL